MRRLSLLLSAVVLCATPALASDEVSGRGPIHPYSTAEFTKRLAHDIHFLHDPASIESFLAALDGEPPDWAAVYGHGHHDPGHDDRLFKLNRERDARRAANPALQTRIAFVWSGELSRFDPDTGGYSVALGPVLTATKWGMVRFKPEDIPGDLRAVPSPEQASRIKRMMERAEPVEIAVMFIGRLLPEESLVYDFSHDQEGLGLIMPFVRLEQVHYLWGQ